MYLTLLLLRDVNLRPVSFPVSLDPVELCRPQGRHPVPTNHSGSYLSTFPSRFLDVTPDRSLPTEGPFSPWTYFPQNLSFDVGRRQVPFVSFSSFDPVRTKTSQERQLLTTNRLSPGTASVNRREYDSPPLEVGVLTPRDRFRRTLVGLTLNSLCASNCKKKCF